MALRLYNTLIRQKEDFVPVKEGEVGIYACGVTVYDTCHVGHARSAINFDVITRYLRYRGYKVTYVKNFTDVDDKIIVKANKEGVELPRDLRALHHRAQRRHGPARHRAPHRYSPGDGAHRGHDRSDRQAPRRTIWPMS